MTNPNPKKILIDYANIAIGISIAALGVYLFFMPHSIVVGGVTGLGIIVLHHTADWAFPIPVWLTNLIVNIPLILIALKVIGVKFIAKTIFSAAFLTFALFLLEQFVPFFLETDLFLASVMGGVVCGIGVGLVYRQQATTGGSVLVATLLHKIIRHVPMSRILMFLDWSVILGGFFIFGSERTMYALITIFITTKTMEYVIDGTHFAKAAFIVSEDSDNLADVISQKMNRGVTSLSGKGHYSGEAKNVLLCVVSKREIARLKEVVRAVDKKAFVIVADVREVLGEGFRDFDKQL